MLFEKLNNYLDKGDLFFDYKENDVITWISFETYSFIFRSGKAYQYNFLTDNWTILSE